MAIKTVVKMNIDVDIVPVATELRRLEGLGFTVADQYETGPQRETIRTWTTLEAAQGWVDFLNGVTPPPISAQVVVD